MQKSAFPDNTVEREKCKSFLENFSDIDGENKYISMLQEVANRMRKTFPISLDDVYDFENDIGFINRIEQNTQRYIELFSRAADSLIPNPSINLGGGDIYDIYLTHREQRLAAIRTDDDVTSGFPVELTRRFELRILPRLGSKVSKLREIKAKDVGSLVSVKGIVTRVSDVQPLVQVIAYICQVCGFESYQTVKDKTVNPLAECPSPACKQNETQGKLIQLTRGSKFVRYQEIKLQEQPIEVPVGHIPRALSLKVYGELTRKCTPGELVTVAGVFLPAPYTGYRAIRAGLTTETYIQVMNIESHKKTYNEFEFTPELLDEVEAASEEKDVFDNLASSIAPEIFGHDDIKKALILLLVGGVTRTMKDGMKIRGDINVLLMGDPGVAKSQLLKHIAHISPRGIYTTGKGSSGVGLTAAVTKDPVTGEMALEGGALVLADKGICCIDEFDKMEEGDRTAIHEVMEQQTVSIAKAGITTTLNARTCVLAAANPVFGRWRSQFSAERNLGIPAALLSRFDLTFILLDRPDEDFDEALAKHVTHVHRENKHPELDFEPFSPAFLRAYISRARQHEPWIPPELTDFIVGSYVALRKEDDEDSSRPAKFQGTNKRARFCTARSLLSILRLSQALARIHFRNEVSREDCEEALRLMYVAKHSHFDEDQRKKIIDYKSAIYDMIVNTAMDKRSKEISRNDVLKRVLMKNFTELQLDETLEEYADLNVWALSKNKQKIRMIAHGR